MNTICASETVKGIDVSHWQGDVDWEKQKEKGIEFALIKAEDLYKGVVVKDSLFYHNWGKAQEIGLLRGAYAFFHPQADPILQADALAQFVGGALGQGDLPCIIDWEITEAIPSLEAKANAMTFLKEVERLTLKTPMVYGSPYFLLSANLGEEFKKYPLWVAHYGVRCPLVPPPWETWTFWQWTNGNGLDMDFFNGSLEELKKL